MNRKIVLALALLLPGTITARQPSAALPVINGRVVDALTGEPVAQAEVYLAKVFETERRMPVSRPYGDVAMTDATGGFTFNAESSINSAPVTGGAFRLSADKAGYLPGLVGQLRPGGPFALLDLAPAGHVETTISLWRTATIAGRVTYADGRPVGPGASGLVRAVRLPADPSSGVCTECARATDAAGRYEIPDLAPGDYIITLPMGSYTARVEDPTKFGSLASIRPTGTLVGLFGYGVMSPRLGPNGQPRTYEGQFFPGTTDSRQATVVHLGPGERREGFDFTLREIPATTVAGLVIAQGIAKMDMSLAPAVPFPGDQVMGFGTQTDANRRFVFADVPAGRYVLRTSEARPSVHGLEYPPQYQVTTTRPIVIGERGVRDVRVRVDQGRIIAGQVQFEGTTGPKRAVVGLNPIGQAGFEGIQGPFADAGSGSFSVTVSPGRFLLSAYGNDQPNNWVNDTPNWFVKSAFYRGQDVTLQPLDVRDSDVRGVVVMLTKDAAEIAGSVRSPSGEVRTDGTVVAFPADSRAWTDVQGPSLRVAVDRAMSGRFLFRTLPPGDYYLAAAEDRFLPELGRALFERLRGRATRVRTTTGRTVAINLVVP